MNPTKTETTAPGSSAPGTDTPGDGPTQGAHSDSHRRLLEMILDASDEDVPLETLTAETSLRDDLDLSSMQAITLVMDLEDAFSVEVEDEEIEALATVGDVLALLDRKLDAADGDPTH